MISICLYPQNLWSVDKPQETAENIIQELTSAPPLGFGTPFQFKYGREVRDILGGRHPAQAYFTEVEKILRTHIQERANQLLGN